MPSTDEQPRRIASPLDDLESPFLNEALFVAQPEAEWEPRLQRAVVESSFHGTLERALGTGIEPQASEAHAADIGVGGAERLVESFLEQVGDISERTALGSDQPLEEEALGLKEQESGFEMEDDEPGESTFTDEVSSESPKHLDAERRETFDEPEIEILEAEMRSVRDDAWEGERRKSFEKDEKVEWVQTVLIKTQKERLKSDGLYGDKTAAAVTRFQKVNGLTLTGKVDSATETALIQRALEAIAQQSLFPTAGFKDQRTVEELQRFQGRHGLEENGESDSATRAAMVASLWGFSLPEPHRHSVSSPAPEEISNGLAFDLRGLSGNLQTAMRAAGEEGGKLLMKIGRIARPAFTLRSSGTVTDGNVSRRLQLNDSVFVERSIKGRPQDVLSWYYVYTSPDEEGTGYSGWVRSDGVLLDPPEPEARVHFVQSGEKLIDIAAKYYKPQGGFEWGDDARFYVAALAFVNKGYAGIIFPKGWKDEFFQKRDAWKEIHIKAGHAIWIPKKEVLQPLKGQFVSSGSITYELWQKLKKLAKRAWRWIVYGAAFIAGLIHGALRCVYDLFADAVELVKVVWRIIKGFFTGDIIKDAKALWEMIKEIDLSQMAEDFLTKWNSNDPWDQGYFQGTVIGYVVVEVLLAIFSVGVITSVKWAGRFAKVSSIFAKSSKFQRFAAKVQKIKHIPDPAGEHLAMKFTGVTTEAARLARRVLQKRITDIKILQELWEAAGRAAQKAPDLTTTKSARTTFDLHRDRFWPRVRGSPDARKMFEDAGFVFGDELAPVYPGLPGRFGKVSIDHIDEIATARARALDPANLQFVIMGDNSILPALKRAMPEWPDTKVRLQELE